MAEIDFLGRSFYGAHTLFMRALMKKKLQTSGPVCVCIRLRRVAQKITDFYDKMLSPAGLSVNQYSLLVNISRIEGCGTGELARQVKLEKSTLVRTLQPLLREGLIMDTAAEGNRRRQLCLTPHGREVLKKAIPLWNKAQEDIVSRLGTSHETLMELFGKVDSWE